MSGCSMKLWTLLSDHRANLLTVLLAVTLLVCALADARTGKIPPVCNFALAGLGILRLLCAPSRWPEHLAGFFGVSVPLLFVFGLTDEKGVGGGDIKLTAAAGLFLGWERILWAFFLGGLFSLAGFAFQRIKERQKRAMALGPYLAAGMLAAALLG